MSERGPTASLIGAARVLVAGVFLFAVVAGLFTWSVLSKIEADASNIQSYQLPQVLAQNRNALKLEKLTSYVRSAFLARDPALERQIQLQTRLLSQSFALDADAALTAGAAALSDQINRIIAARAGERRNVGVAPAVDGEAVQAYEEAMALSDQLASGLSTGTARVADAISTDIQSTAGSVRNGWLVILSMPLIGALVLFLFFRSQVIHPIEDTVRRLIAIRERKFGAHAAEPARFHELRQIQLAVEEFANLSEELFARNELLVALSDQDPLTKISNRRSFDTALGAEIETAQRTGDDLALLLLDIDHFKLVNDLYGHQAGDACIRSIGALLAAQCKPFGFMPARYGGEEFAAIMPKANAQAALDFAESLRILLQDVEVATGTGPAVKITASIGVAMLADVDARQSDLIRAADGALYLAKRSGRNRVCFHQTSPMDHKQARIA